VPCKLRVDSSNSAGTLSSSSAGLNSHRKPLLDPLRSGGAGAPTAMGSSGPLSSPLGGGDACALNTSSMSASSGAIGGGGGGGNNSTTRIRGVLCSPLKLFCRPSSIRCMNFMARFVLWSAIFAMALAVLWYTYELYVHG
jgi:hypothetical protein